MNPAVEALGYPPGSRLLITHLDDLGMNLGANEAWESCHKAGALSSASVMMPCPWAPEALERAARMEATGSLPDLGVHLTLTCEWNSYRWGAYGPGRQNLLTDSEAYLPRNREEHLEITSSPDGRKAVKAEIEAQLEGALCHWPDITHIDTHMFILLYPPNLGFYINLALKHRIPAMIPGTVEAWRPWTGNVDEAREMADAVSPAGDAGMPLFDRVCGIPLENPPADRPAAARKLIRDCVPGLNFLFLHANTDSAELRAIAGDWKERTGDLEVFSDVSLREFIRDEGIHLIGMRELRNLMRKTGRD